MASPFQKLAFKAGLMALVLGAAAVLWWLCDRCGSIAFLPGRPGAEWIVTPRPLEACKRETVPVRAVYRRSFQLEKSPSQAQLSFCAFKNCTVNLNGQLLTVPIAPPSDWKTPITIEVGTWVRPGFNELVVEVVNETGPPALWLKVRSNGQMLGTDESWKVDSTEGTVRHARLARWPARIVLDSALAGGEQMKQSLRRLWFPFLALGIVCAGVVGLLDLCGRRPPTTPVARWNSQSCVILLWAVLALRAALFWHDASHLPRTAGFDVHGHEDYVRYVLENLSVPRHDEGWEMHQGPLYYAVSALWLGFCGLSTGQDEAVLPLRAVNGVLGLIECWLVWCCLRQLVPDNLPAQAVGLAVGAFLPPHLLLSNYVTNELLCAVLITAAFVLCLRGLRQPEPTLGLHLALGTLLGAALLAKSSALLAVPLFPLAIALRLVLRSNWAPPAWARSLGCLLLGCVLVCGWQWSRLVAFGSSAALGIATGPTGWWQDPGYRSVAYYASFGRSLEQPLFSGFYGFADGLYSTLWGDGLISGASRLAGRVPWRYDWMNLAYLLALWTSLLLLIGLVAALKRVFCHTSLDWALAVGLLGAFALGILYMSLRIPAYSEVKAFFGLPALAPFSAVAALGWSRLQERRWTRVVGGTLVLIWTVTVCIAFWVQA